MTIPWRDRVATIAVAIAVVLYVAWLAGLRESIPIGTLTLAILVLGILGSVAAVAPGFWALLSGSRPYLALTSLGGAIAFVAAVLTMLNSTELTLAVLVVMTIALWVVATAHHLPSWSSTGTRPARSH